MTGSNTGSHHIFPRATGEMKDAGWTIDPTYLHRLHDHIEALPEHWGVAEEGIEEVLLAIEALGNGHTFSRTGAYALTATCKHGIHPYDCNEGCDPHRMVP